MLKTTQIIRVNCVTNKNYWIYAWTYIYLSLQIFIYLSIYTHTLYIHTYTHFQTLTHNIKIHTNADVPRPSSSTVATRQVARHQCSALTQTLLFYLYSITRLRSFRQLHLRQNSFVCILLHFGLLLITATSVVLRWVLLNYDMYLILLSDIALLGTNLHHIVIVMVWGKTALASNRIFRYSPIRQVLSILRQLLYELTT